MGVIFTSCLLPFLISLVIGVMLLIGLSNLLRRRKEWPEFAREEGFEQGKTEQGYACLSGYSQGKKLFISLVPKLAIDLTPYNLTVTRVELEEEIGKVEQLTLLSGHLAGRIKKAVGRNELTTGNEDIDKKVSVSGKPAERIRQAILKDAVRHQMLSFQDLCITLEDRRLVFQRPSIVAEKSELKRIISLLLSLYESLES